MRIRKKMRGFDEAFDELARRARNHASAQQEFDSFFISNAAFDALAVHTHTHTPSHVPRVMSKTKRARTSHSRDMK